MTRNKQSTLCKVGKGGEIIAFQVGDLFARLRLDSARFDEGMDNSESRMGKLGGTFTKIGLGMAAAFGTATVAVGVLAVSLSDDLQKSLNGVQASTGVADEGMEDMRETMLAIYNNNFGEDFEDIGKAMSTISQQTGLAGEALQKATEDGIALRDTFDMEVNESIRSVDMMMEQFGITSDEAFNLIAQGAEGGLDKNGNLLDSVNEYSVHFEQLGFDAEEMFNMMANGAESGVFDIDKLGDAMKEFGIRSKDGSKASMEAFEALGLDSDKMTKAFAAGGDTAKAAFDKTTKALFAMKDPVAQNAAGVALFGTQWEDVGIEGMKALTNTKGEIGKNVEALEKINEVKYDTFGEAMQGIKRNLETGLLIPLGEKIMPKMNEFADWIKEHMPEIKNEAKYAFDLISEAIGNVVTAVGVIIGWFKKYKAIIVPIVTVVAAVIVNAWAVTTAKAIASAITHGIQSLKVVANWLLMGVKSTFHALKVVASWVATSVGAVKSALVTAGQAAIVVAKWLWMGVKSAFHALVVVASWVATSAGAIAAGIVMGAQAAIVVAKWAWMGVQATIQATKMAAAWVISMGPIAWAIGLLIAAGVALYMNWDIVKAKASDLWTAIGNSFKKGVNGAIGWINNLIRMINKIPGVNAPLISRIELKYTNNSKAKTMDDRLGNSGYKPPGKNAQGTDNWRGGLTWVGEQGPELINLPRGSQVRTNRESMDMTKGDNGGTVINFNVENKGTIVGSNGMGEFADIVSQKIARTTGLTMGGGW